ncbi:MAG: hypothetical protein KC468_14320, partial [Myxococcales bacterium]|nr:hypothetical protein [Myxococcales bacterium]
MPAEPDRPRWLRRLFAVERDELPAVLWGAATSLVILCSFYMLRPVRDEMGIEGGVDQLKWLFGVTFTVNLALVPLYSALVARLPRRRFVALVYHGFALAFAGFAALFATVDGAALPWLARVFFVWVSVMPTFVTSVFWELAADIFRREQGERLFGMIMIGGSVGAVLGPLLTASLAAVIGPAGLCVLSALLLELAILGILGLLSAARRASDRETRPSATTSSPTSSTTSSESPSTTSADETGVIGGSPFAGFTLVIRDRRLLGIAGYMALMALTGTFLYFEQAAIVKASLPDRAARTELFAYVDLTYNALALLAQLLVFRRVVTRLGLGIGLAVLPLLCALGFMTLGAAPILLTVVVFHVLQRATRFAMSKPAREVLFTTVSREAKYKAKSFIDTVVYRGSDFLSGLAFDGLKLLGLGLSGLALVMVPASLVWAALALRLGRATPPGAATPARGDSP